MPPRPDQVEVTLLGPGYGECVMVCLGGGNWIVVDSCRDNETNQVTALSYLEGLGIDPEKAVRLVIASHWHDDHIAGMNEIVSRCAHATFCCGSALGKEEFLGLVCKFSKGHFSLNGPGVREIYNVFETLRKQDRKPKYALANRSVLTVRPGDSGHGWECKVQTLSPSDTQFDKFLTELTTLMPEVRETKYRCLPQKPNRLAVVTWLEIGPIRILLGSDLEETEEEDGGWSAIVTSSERPAGKASVFKIAHHGSANAHNDEVWSEMLVADAFAVLSPFNRGSKLPSPKDVARINTLTPEAYSTAKLRVATARRRPAAVEKTLKEAGVKLHRAEPRTGAVRLRNRGRTKPDNWHVELFQDACRLSEVHKAS